MLNIQQNDLDPDFALANEIDLGKDAELVAQVNFEEPNATIENHGRPVGMESEESVG